MTGGPDGCGRHGGPAGELRAFAIAALDRLQPAVERLRAEVPSGEGSTSCAACPVCALIAALRGERPELASRLAEQAAGLLAVLRSALAEGAGGPSGPAEPAASHGPRRPVQRIPVYRG